MEVADYIFSILKHQIMILLSWGFTNPVAIDESEEAEGGLLFSVSGFLHKGSVEVLLAWDDTFTVKLINKDGSVHEIINDVYVDNLVSVIDSHVEKVADYRARVKGEYAMI